MFEAAELGHKVSKAEFKKRELELRVGLLNAQYDLRKTSSAVVIVIAGSDRPGSNDLLRDLHGVMDGRYMQTNALGVPTDEELERPHFWRYWRRLPRRGEIGVFLGGWPLDLIRDRINDEIDDGELEQRIGHIQRFEQGLCADSAVLLKFWLHLPKQQLKKRLKQAKKNPDRAWQLDETDWRIYDLYDDVMAIAERVLRETSTGDAPWHVIESTDTRYRNLRVGETILGALTKRLSSPSVAARPPGRAQASRRGRRARTVLSTVDLSSSLARPAYRKQLQRYQGKLSRLMRKARAKGVSSILVFEGWDAAGKGGVIRRVIGAINPETCHVIPISAPTEDEKAHHYLWRFWRHLPRAGRVAIFDRSWYGRVLVERVEGFASEAEWRRAYGEINDFEDQLTEHGTLVLKFWLHLHPDEQLRRFRARQETPYKKYKLTDEDYRNREKWPDYEAAVHEMVARTSTADAPWHLVASNDKRWARVDVLKAFCGGLKRVL
jgi:polyphosphate:AMP phosphotransferase